LAVGENSIVGGGIENNAIGVGSTIGGGEDNDATGDFSAVSGGIFNSATGDFSYIGGGKFNEASGKFSIAMGINASAKKERSLVINLDKRKRASSKKVGEFLVSSTSFRLQIGNKEVTINKKNIQNFKDLLNMKDRRHLQHININNEDLHKQIDEHEEQINKQQENIDENEYNENIPNDNIIKQNILISSTELKKLFINNSLLSVFNYFNDAISNFNLKFEKINDKFDYI